MTCTLTAFVLLLQLLILVGPGAAIWFPWYFHRYGLSLEVSCDGDSHTKVSCPPGYELRYPSAGQADPHPASAKGSEPDSKENLNTVGKRRVCEDNPMLIQLARVYVVSPERIVLLLTEPSLPDSCEEVEEVLRNIRASTKDCVMTPSNIYGKLADGLDFFRKEVCEPLCDGNRKRSTRLTDAHDCIRELRTDMIECEAPADWYERSNKTKVCHIFNDVLDCYYTRAALLCGVKPAKELRSFAGDCMNQAMVHQCPVKRQLPHVDNAMPLGISGAA
ncbi:hypothetical protein KR018_008854, partial [Drosophila ironensis]